MSRVKTECSEDELPLDPDFAKVLLDWKGKCRTTVGDWVFPSPITDRCYHASPIQQDYIRPAAEKLDCTVFGGTHSAIYLPRLARCGARADRSAAEADASCTSQHHGNVRWFTVDAHRRDANSKVVRMALAAGYEEGRSRLTASQSNEKGCRGSLFLVTRGSGIPVGP